MKKLLKFLALAQLVCLLIFAGMLLADKQTLGNDLVRLHVVGASDTEADQTVKLFVRDAIVAHTDKLLAGAQDADAACAILEANLDALTQTANEALMAAGSTDIAAVSLQREAFPVRHYESFSLPSGVYRALRVKIGSAQGANWWCVLFPPLCILEGEAGEIEYEEDGRIRYKSLLAESLHRGGREPDEKERRERVPAAFDPASFHSLGRHAKGACDPSRRNHRRCVRFGHDG